MWTPTFGTTIVLTFCTAWLGILAPPALSAQGRADLSWSTDGPLPDSLPKLRNPGYLMDLEPVRAVLVDLRHHSRDRSYVNSVLEGSGVSLDDLLATQLVTVEGELYAPGFPLLTSEDIRAVREISGRYAHDLAERYLQHRADFWELLRRYSIEQIPPGRLAFVLIGCFSLDWDGLDLTEKSGYRTPFLESGVGKVHWATEKQPRELRKGMYSGSHNEYLDSDVVLTSFGDQYSPFRFAFPDLVWGLGRALPDLMWQAARQYGGDVPKELRPALAGVSREVLSELADRVGTVMMALRTGDKTFEEIRDITGSGNRETEALLSLLEALGYVGLESGLYATAIPVLSEEDRAMVQGVLSLSRDLMAGWFEENYDQLRRDLTRATPVGGSVPFEDTFYYIWHYVFGITNRVLVEKGMFEDPYAADRKYTGFVPVVWQRTVNETVDTGESR